MILLFAKISRCIHPLPHSFMLLDVILFYDYLLSFESPCHIWHPMKAKQSIPNWVIRSFRIFKRIWFLRWQEGFSSFKMSVIILWVIFCLFLDLCQQQLQIPMIDRYRMLYDQMYFKRSLCTRFTPFCHSDWYRAASFRRKRKNDNLGVPNNSYACKPRITAYGLETRSILG